MWLSSCGSVTINEFIDNVVAKLSFKIVNFIYSSHFEFKHTSSGTKCETISKSMLLTF